MRRTVMAVVTLLTVGLLYPAVAAGPALAAAPDHVNSTLEGCKLGTYTLVPYPHCTGAGDYTTGNLGKDWSELDLVPYRLTLSAGGGAPATQVYTLGAAFDNVDGGTPGYDAVGPWVLVSGPCTFTQGTTQTFSPGLGGTDTTIYRLLTVTQAKNTTCVFDTFARLAVGAHNFSGSSLHGSMITENLTTVQGSADVPINPKEISPQELRKDMAATQADSEVTWNITKAATPSDLSFGDICDTNSPSSLTTKIKIEWTKNAATGGDITVTTNVYAKNPANRVITVNATDIIKSGTTALDTFSTPAGGVDVPANTEVKLFTHTTTVPAGTTNLNDVATATYTDKLTGVPVPGSTTATASATVQPGNTNNSTATITDVESITGSGFTYSLDAITGDADALNGDDTNGYVLGTETSSDITWDSGTVSASGSVTLEKTVYFDGAAAGTGTLSDTATLNASQGFKADASADVDLSATKSASITINKSTTVPVDGDTDFVFNVTGGSLPAGGTDVTVTILDGQIFGTADLTGLDDGDYVITETDAGGFTPVDPIDVKITAADCTVVVPIENTFGPASAEVIKVVKGPVGTSLAGFEFTLFLDDDATPGPSAGDTLYSGPVTTDASGQIAFPDALADEGDYYVVETDTPDGFIDNGGDAACAFTVDYPADADKLFTCTWTNTLQATATVQKVTVPAGDEAGWEFTLFKDEAPAGVGPEDTVVGSPVTTTDGSAVDFGVFLDEGSYYVLETDGPAGFVPTGSTGCEFTVAYPGDAGKVFDCQFTNAHKATADVTKVTNPTGNEAGFDFKLYKDVAPAGLGPEDEPPIATTTSVGSGALNFGVNLEEGNYIVVEVPKTGWEQQGGNCTFSVDYPADAGKTFHCTFTNTAKGSIGITKTGGSAGQAFTFELRQGVTPPSNGGTLLDTETVNSGGAQVKFKIGGSTDLPLGDYTICEIVPAPGWSSNLGGANQYNLVLLDNEIRVCTNVSITVANQDLSINVANTPPPGGEQATIGFWKNHASCKLSNGKQAPVLDQTLAKADPAGTTLGILTLHAGDCVKARNILDKTTIDGKKKMASDPLFNMAAQLLAAKLNVTAGAGTCPAATSAINAGQALLAKYNWNGLTYSPALTAADKTAANNLNTVLDSYNNGTLC